MQRVFDGKHLHAYVFQFIEPKFWVVTLSRVCKQWYLLCRSDTLWIYQKRNVLKLMPSMQRELIRRATLYEFFRSICSTDVSFILENMRLCAEIGHLNVDEYIGECVTVDAMRMKTTRSVVVFYHDTRHNGYEKTLLTSVESIYRFMEPVRQLVKYGYVRYPDRCLLWASTVMNVLLISQIAQKRKRFKKE